MSDFTRAPFVFCKMALLNLQSLLLYGLIKRHGWLDIKFGLWSFKLKKAGVFAKHSTLVSTTMFFAICFATRLIVFSKRAEDFS